MTVWKSTFFSLTYFIVKTQYIAQITYKVCINWLFILAVGFLSVIHYL